LQPDRVVNQATSASRQDRTGLLSAINALSPWFHNFDFDGVKTAPHHFLGDYPRVKWQRFEGALPADLRGATVLDIGCNGGFYSIEMKRRGADRVLGVDVDPRYLAQAHLAAELSGVRIELRQLSVYEIARLQERFDIVLFMGVLYHLRYPLLGLDIVARKVGRRMIFQTLTSPGEDVAEPPVDMPIHERDAMVEPGWPKMAFIEHRLANDPTNWWAPNHACVEAMLRSAGLRVLERPGHEIYVCEPGEPREELAWIEDELRAATGRPVPRKLRG
jgi:tRNA (mo5U34)-methyltransferase